MHLSDESRHACSLICKAWRYAAHLSAQQLLRRYYPGARLEAHVSLYGTSMSQLNFWRYLVSRRNERDASMSNFACSFLYDLFSFKCIGSGLWSNPDHNQQLVIAVRFLVARTWLSANVSDQRVVNWTNCTIIDAQPASNILSGAKIVNDEIWRISVQSTTSPPSKPEAFWIIAETGEVIGRQHEDPFATSPTSADINPDLFSANKECYGLRIDWANLLLGSSAANSSTRLLDRVRWSNTDDYAHGISKHWLKKRTEAALLGAADFSSELLRAERIVAERYIIANVAENSLSGRYQTAIEMAREFSGEPNAFTIPVKSPLASLYIPEHHFVESVHFNTSPYKPGFILHPALAIVQTPTRESFILRDTGGTVGCEEDGVRPVWMDILRCSSDGCIPIPVI